MRSTAVEGLLRFLEPTRDLGAFVREPDVDRTRSERDVLLRHDVDHSIEAALRLAHAEAKMEIRATYFLLHGASYWDSSLLLEAVRQITDFGHEVGLHINALAEWYSGARVSDVIERALSRLRSTGVEVSGCSAHGDRRCYEGQFINYWAFEELRPAEPLLRESGRSAEGILTSDESRQIRYPIDHAIVRPDGERFRLWSLRMVDFGLAYEASHVDTDRYFSDSGGTWQDGKDPEDHDLSTGTSQVLMHPEYWQPAPRTYWFLSTARAGTKWLAGRLDKAASVTAFHETTLNVVATDGGLESSHITGPGFAEAANDRSMMRSRVIDRLGWIDDNIEGDSAECNVYLPFVLEDTLDLLRRGTLVHLRRDPWEVISSLLERDWYDTAHDDRHPAFSIPGWADLTQIERIAWYVRIVQEWLDAVCDVRVDLSDLTRSAEDLSRFLDSIGIAYYPRLSGDDFDVPIDATRSRVFPLPPDWPPKVVQRVRRILEADASGFGLAEAKGRRQQDDSHDNEDVGRLVLRWSADEPPPPFTVHGCTREDGLHIKLTPDGIGHAHAVFGGSRWRSANRDTGFVVDMASEYEVVLEGEARGAVWLFLIAYSEAGELLRARRLKALRDGMNATRFRVRPDAARFDIAVYMPRAIPASALAIGSFELIERQSRENLLQAPSWVPKQ